MFTGREYRKLQTPQELGICSSHHRCRLQMGRWAWWCRRSRSGCTVVSSQRPELPHVQCDRKDDLRGRTPHTDAQQKLGKTRSRHSHARARWPCSKGKWKKKTSDTETQCRHVSYGVNNGILPQQNFKTHFCDHIQSEWCFYTEHLSSEDLMFGESLTCVISCCWCHQDLLHNHKPGLWSCAPSGSHSPEVLWSEQGPRRWSGPAPRPQTVPNQNRLDHCVLGSHISRLKKGRMKRANKRGKGMSDRKS